MRSLEGFLSVSQGAGAGSVRGEKVLRGFEQRRLDSSSVPTY